MTKSNYGSWLKALGYWLLDLGSWLLVIGSWFLVLGSWFLALDMSMDVALAMGLVKHKEMQ